MDRKEEEEYTITPSYHQWNENLGKKFSVLYKNYKKFEARFLLVA